MKLFVCALFAVLFAIHRTPLGAAFVVSAGLLVILLRLAGPYPMAAMIASFALIGFGAYRVRQSAAARLLRTA